MTDDFFRNRLDQMFDLRNPLAVLAQRMPWQEIEASLSLRWAREVMNRPEIELTPKSWTVAVQPTKRCFSAGTPPD